jgi:hypothetical protein
MPLESCIETNVTEILVFKIQKVVVPDDITIILCASMNGVRVSWCEMH